MSMLNQQTNPLSVLNRVAGAFAAIAGRAQKLKVPTVIRGLLSSDRLNVIHVVSAFERPAAVGEVGTSATLKAQDVKHIVLREFAVCLHFFRAAPSVFDIARQSVRLIPFGHDLSSAFSVRLSPFRSPFASRLPFFWIGCIFRVLPSIESGFVSLSAHFCHSRMRCWIRPVFFLGRRTDSLSIGDVPSSGPKPEPLFFFRCHREAF